jgi:hypothetical protein
MDANSTKNVEVKTLNASLGCLWVTKHAVKVDISKQRSWLFGRWFLHANLLKSGT